MLQSKHHCLYIESNQRLVAHSGPVFNALGFTVAHIAQMFPLNLSKKDFKTLSEMNKLTVEVISAKAVIQK